MILFSAQNTQSLEGKLKSHIPEIFNCKALFPLTCALLQVFRHLLILKIIWGKYKENFTYLGGLLFLYQEAEETFSDTFLVRY